MSVNSFDTLTRGAAKLSRRGSLAIVGGATLAALWDAASAKSGKAGKKSKKRCRRQKQQCLSFYQGFCQGNPFCEEDHFACCAFLANCNASGYLQCYHAIV